MYSAHGMSRLRILCSEAFNDDRGLSPMGLNEAKPLGYVLYKPIHDCEHGFTPTAALTIDRST